MTPRKSKADKAIDQRVGAAYYAACSGIQIDIMDISKVFAAGRVAIENGADDDALKVAVRAFVETIRHN